MCIIIFNTFKLTPTLPICSLRFNFIKPKIQIKSSIRILNTIYNISKPKQANKNIKIENNNNKHNNLNYFSLK